MDNTNSFDWVAVQMQHGDKSFNDLNTMGVDGSNTSLQSADYYKQQPKIQQTFKKADGTFDNDKFNTFYLNAAQTLNQYKKSDSSIGNVTTDVWDDTLMARQLGATIRNKPVAVELASKEPFTALKQAQGSFYGLTEINKWTKPTKSLSEVAQQRKVRDGVTGKELDYDAQDTGLFNLYGFLREPLVLATYDQDQKDDKGKVIHKRGEYKFDDKGLPYYETLAGRDPSGKQILSSLDTLTKEGSFWNKYDFFDSDGLDKSITGTLVKTAVQAAPMLLGGPLSTAYTAYYIASGLTDASAEILKTIDGIFGGPNAKNDAIYKWANSLQGYTGQWKSSMSDYGKEHFFSLESIAQQAVDSLYQLKSQKAIVEWPLEFTKYQMAKQLGIATEGALSIGDDATKALYNIDSYASKYGNSFVKSAEALSQNVDKLHKYQTYAEYMSRAYMAATSAVGITQSAKEAGLDARDTGFLYLGYTAALTKLFGTEYAHFVEERIGGLDDFARHANSMLGREGGTILPAIMADTEKQLTGTTKRISAMGMLKNGKELAKSVFDKINGLDARTALGSSLKEGFEEMTEQSIQNALQVVYNGLKSAGITSTTDDDAKFDTDPADILKDVATNGLGGILGGLVFHFADPHHGGLTFKGDKLIDYVVEGHGDRVKERIEDMKSKGQFGDTQLSMNPLLDANGVAIKGMYQPVNDKNPTSQNDFIADNLTKTVTVLEELMKQHNIQNPYLSEANKAKFYQNIVDPGTDTDYRQQLNSAITNVFKISSEIGSLDGLDKDTNDTMLQKKAELKEAKEHLEYLQGDESIDEFFVQGLFNISTNINQAFGVKNRETIAKDKTGKTYSELTDKQKSTIDDLYNEYKTNLGEGGLRDDLKKGRLAYQHFDHVMESKGHYKEINAFKESIDHLNKYVVKKIKEYTPEGETEPVARGTTYLFVQDYLAKLNGVKYVPDYIYDQLKESIGYTASNESQQILSQLSLVQDIAKKAVNKSLRTGLDNDVIRKYTEKVLGDKVFAELFDTDEYKDLRDNAIPRSDYSTLHLLKGLASQGALQDNSELHSQLQLANGIESFDYGDIDTLQNQLDDQAEDKDSRLYQFLDQFDGLTARLEEYREKGFFSDNYSHLFTKEGLEKFIRANLISKTLGGLSFDEVEKLLNNGVDNVIFDLLTGSDYNVKDNLGSTVDTLYHSSIQNADYSSIHQAIDNLKNFNKTRVSSPLKETNVLGEVYEFLDNQNDALKMVGLSNYLNADEDFMKSYDVHLNTIQRIASLIQATAMMNPVINDFRAAHKGMIGEKNKDIILTILEDADAATLMHEANRAAIDVEYLRDVNYYNVNNVLQKLLREDGYELVQKVNALRAIITPETLQLVPALGNLAKLDAINNYVSNYRLASQDQKAEALYNMAKFEESVFADVSKLSESDKLNLINTTFSPIVPNERSFYDNINPEEELNDAHRTLYLASIFGSSTLDFYKRYAGEENAEDGTFENLTNSKYIPFAKQESAIRLFHMVMNGDRTMLKYLLNAYTYEAGASDIDFSRPAGQDVFSSQNILTILGSPGTGKTTAVLSMIMNFIDSNDSNTVLLGPKERQLNGLKNAVIKSGFESKIDSRSSTVKDFLQSLGLRDKKTDTLFDFAKTDAIMAKLPAEASSAVDFRNLLVTPNAGDNDKGLLDPERLNITINGKFNPSLEAALANTRLIVLDEFTHVNPIDIQILNKIIEKYNQTDKVVDDPTKRITLVNLGDNNQLGFVNNGLRRDFTTMTNTITSPPLLASLRSGWDVINNTMYDVTRRTLDIKEIAGKSPEDLLSSNTLQQSRIPIKLQHVLDSKGNTGIKSINSKTGPTDEDIKFISDNQANFTGKDVVYVVNSDADMPKAKELLAKTFGADWASKANIEIYTPDEVQGGEYKYAIIDASPKMSDNGDRYDIVRTYEFLNTMLSRATEGTLLINNGSMDNFVTFENEQRERAIKQIRINDDVVAKVKANKQKLLAEILRDYTTPEFKQNVSKPKRDEGDYIPIVDVIPEIFDQAPRIPIQTTAKVSNIVAYTTFNTNDDFNKVAGLMKVKPTDFDRKKDDIEFVINSLKYYITRSPELGSGNIALTSNFAPYFADYRESINKPLFFIEARKMSDDYKLAGRSEEFPDKSYGSNTPTLYLKVKLANNNESKPPMVLTLGVLNSLANLNSKFLGKTKVDPEDTKVQGFVKSIGDFFGGRAKTVKADGQDVGTVEGSVWRSKDFSDREWRQFSELWSSRIFYDNNSTYDFNTFKNKYKDYFISEPQVVVASMKGADGKPMLDPDGKNSQYKRYWQQLQGTSIAFMSEIKEMQNLSPDDLLKIYIKQMQFFNNDEFKNAPNKDVKNEKGEVIQKGKQTLIDEIPERINIPTLTKAISYKPNLVEMIRLTNPRDSFINFRERFLTAINTYKDNTPIQELFEKFDMSPYVKDRLAKSLLTVRQFLNDNANKQFFADEILKSQSKEADKRIQEMREYALMTFGETGDFDQDNYEDTQKKKHDSWDDVVIGNYGAIPSVDDFINTLDEVLSLDDKNSIFSRKFNTVTGSNARQNRAEYFPIEKSDLDLNLTSNKQVDFSKNILDLNLLNLFKKTKNLNFAEVLDKAFKVFANLPAESKYDKYRLDSVFKDGMIETMVVANRAAIKGKGSDNILADVKRIGKTYTFGFKGIQQPAYNIDFARLIDNMNFVEKKYTAEEASDFSKEVTARLANFSELPQDVQERLFGEDINDLDAIDDPTELYEALSDINDRLNLINETVRLPLDNMDLTPTTEIAYDLSSNGIVAKHTVESDTKSSLINNDPNFKGLTHDQLDLQYDSSDARHIIFKATTEDDDFKITYDAKNRSVDVQRNEYTQADPIQKFKEAGFIDASPHKFMAAASKVVEEQYVKTGKLREINTVEDLKTKLARELFNNLTEGQRDLVDEHATHGDVNFFDKFVDKYFDNADFLQEMLDNIHAALNVEEGGENGAVSEEFDNQPDLDVDMEGFANNAKEKVQKQTDPMDKVRQDLTTANNKAKDEFETQIRTLFDGSQTTQPLRGWLDNYTLLHRAKAIANLLADINSKLPNKVTLQQLGILEDLSLIDPVQLTKDTTMAHQSDLNTFNKYRKEFKELSKFTNEKLKSC